MSQVNSANTRIRKLKKLYSISSEIIRQFGLKYYIRTALEELTKQKGKLFAPDELSSMQKEFSIDYETYLQRQNTHNVESIQQNISKLHKKPKFSFLLIIDKHSTLENIKQSLDSISNQFYENFNLYLINLSTKQISTKFSSIKINEIKKQNEHKINEIISQIDSDFIGILHSEIILQRDLLYQVVKEFNQDSGSDIFYFDEDYMDKTSERSNPFFKPDWSPYLLRSMNYLGEFFLVRNSILQQINDVELKNINFFYDLILRCSEITQKFSHISKPLFSNKKNTQYHESHITALSNHIKRIGLDATVENGISSNTFRVHYNLDSEPKISILIPTKDNDVLLKRCIDSIKNNTNYKNWEIIIIDNNSVTDKSIKYLKSLPYKIVRYEEPFNYAKMNNLAAAKANGDYLLFLNDDTKALEPDWLTEMVSICKQDNVGAVGSKLIHNNGTIQSAGTAFLKTGAGFHVFENLPDSEFGYFNLHNVIRDVYTNTSACLLTKKVIFTEVGGFDTKFDLFYGDGDLCVKIRSLGYDIVYTPYAKLLHDGSFTIRKETDIFFSVENHQYFCRKWPHIKNGDPFYNNNLDWNYSIAK